MSVGFAYYSRRSHFRLPSVAKKRGVLKLPNEGFVFPQSSFYPLSAVMSAFFNDRRNRIVAEKEEDHFNTV